MVNNKNNKNKNKTIRNDLDYFHSQTFPEC